ncbi:MAG: HPr family phosphocarrier protein [Clostridiales bacterium]|nr:HPr family phosphocarrier protein [Clostridiales bacterium]
MIERSVTLGGDVPFTPRRAHSLVALANTFSSNIILKDARGTFNGKSLLGVLSLGKLTGRAVTLVVEGMDEARAMEALLLALESEQESG